MPCGKPGTTWLSRFGELQVLLTCRDQTYILHQSLEAFVFGEALQRAGAGPDLVSASRIGAGCGAELFIWGEGPDFTLGSAGAWSLLISGSPQGGDGDQVCLQPLGFS